MSTSIYVQPGLEVLWIHLIRLAVGLVVHGRCALPELRRLTLIRNLAQGLGVVRRLRKVQESTCTPRVVSVVFGTDNAWIRAHPGIFSSVVH